MVKAKSDVRSPIIYCSLDTIFDDVDLGMLCMFFSFVLSKKMLILIRNKEENK